MLQLPSEEPACRGEEEGWCGVRFPCPSGCSEWLPAGGAMVVLLPLPSLLPRQPECEPHPQQHIPGTHSTVSVLTGASPQPCSPPPPHLGLFLLTSQVRVALTALFPLLAARSNPNSLSLPPKPASVEPLYPSRLPSPSPWTLSFLILSFFTGYLSTRNGSYLPLLSTALPQAKPYIHPGVFPFFEILQHLLTV